MVVKKESEFESDEESEIKSKDKLVWFIGAGFIILSELFLYLSSQKTGSEFGIVQILFGILTAAVITLFLFWLRYLMASNRYSAIIIFLLVLGAVWYGITRRYQGVYTTIFLSVGGILALAYAIFLFVKMSKK